jgi:hypothetical protein
MIIYRCEGAAMRNFSSTVIGLALVLSACSQSENTEDEVPSEQVAEPSIASVDNSTAYASDPNARFEILSTTKLSNGNIEVLNKRVGPSGTSFSLREISCSKYTYRYLGEGDTLEEAMKNGANPGGMSALTGTSASSDIADAACAKRK